MQEFEIIVDFNGIILADPSRLEAFYDGIAPDTNLYRRFVETNDGDEVVNRGIIVPIIGINDGVYRVLVRENSEKSSVPESHMIVSNGIFRFMVEHYAALMDMANLWEWYPDRNEAVVSMAPGCYEVQINGFREVINGVVEDFGFEFVLKKCSVLPSMTGSLTENMQVRELPS